MPAHFGGRAGQFRQTFYDVAQSINVVGFGPLDLITARLYLFICMRSEASLVQIKRISGSSPAYRKQHSVVFLRQTELPRQLVLHHHFQFPRLLLPYAHGQGSRHHVHFALLKIGYDVFDHISIEGAQILSPGH